MTTLHLGDCLNDCAICADRYHEGQEICDECGYEHDKENDLMTIKGEEE